MIGEFARLVIEGYTAPRQSVRRLLDAGYGIDVAILFLVLGYLVGSIFEVLLGAPGEGSVIAGHIANIVSSAIAIAAVTFLAYRLGRLSGGQSTMPGMFLAMSWHSLVTSFLWPFVFGLRQQMRNVSEAAAESSSTGMPADIVAVSSGALLMGILALLLSVWLLANYIAEAHRFKSTWGVLGVMVGLPMVVAFIVVSVAGGLPA